LKKNNSLTIISIILLTTALFCSNIPVHANTSIDPKIENNQIDDKGLYSSSVFPVSLDSSQMILVEDFTDGKMPPVDPNLGPWVHEITANNATWYIDDSHPYTKLHCLR